MVSARRPRIIRQLVLELSEITVGLVITVAAVIYLGWYVVPAVTAAVLLAVAMSLVTLRRAQAVLRNPIITVSELRRRGSMRQER